MSNKHAEWLRAHAGGWSTPVADQCRAAADEIDRLARSEAESWAQVRTLIDVYRAHGMGSAAMPECVSEHGECCWTPEHECVCQDVEFPICMSGNDPMCDDPSCFMCAAMRAADKALEDK